MTRREYVFAVVDGLEEDLNGARESLSEFAYQEWAEQFDRLPEAMLRELWRNKQ